MKAMLALVRREYLEHRGPFLYAPLVLLGLLAILFLGGLGTGRLNMPFGAVLASEQRFFQFGFLILCGLWFIYLLVALFFYFADAFNADRRNNSMLFWKSMPVSDFTVLFSKLLAGLTLFPALVYAAALATGVLVFVTAAAASLLHGYTLPGPLLYLGSAWDVAGFALVYLVLALLWYAPFFAWVGALSTLVGRWSIPLAFLVPALAGLAEKLVTGRSGPGLVLTYLHERLQFYRPDSTGTLAGGDYLAGGRLLGELLASIDWAQLAGGLIFATLAVYVASEYRRRRVAA